MIYHHSQIRYFTNRPFISISSPLLFSSKANFITLRFGFGYPRALTRARTSHPERSYRYVDSFIPKLSMPPLSPRQKHANKFRRQTDRSFWRLRLNTDIHAATPTKQEPVRRQQGGVFAAIGRGQTAVTYQMERLYSKRWVNENVFYLVQWKNYHDLTWEPSRNLHWKLKAMFERENIDFVWMHQSPRGRRRRRMPRTQPTRRSARFQAEQLAWSWWSG
jgi:hypothetical protein